MKDTDLKHLEIHTWIANKVSMPVGKGSSFPLFKFFIAKNHLAREGPQSESPVNIPALTTIVDGQFKEDRTLYLVPALRYYLDDTNDLRGSRILTLYIL